MWMTGFRLTGYVVGSDIGTRFSRGLLFFLATTAHSDAPYSLIQRPDPAKGLIIRGSSSTTMQSSATK
jgi:hypothetical protein